jgi:hypothetical protein
MYEFRKRNNQVHTLVAKLQRYSCYCGQFILYYLIYYSEVLRKLTKPNDFPITYISNSFLHPPHTQSNMPYALEVENMDNEFKLFRSMRSIGGCRESISSPIFSQHNTVR